MKNVPEAFLHYIWKYNYFDQTNLTTQEGEQIEILSPGQHNRDAGPDFFNAKIKINETIWAGNVEIHIHSSDWYRHKHHEDKSYDNVILQVVLYNDRTVERTNGSQIPTVEMNFNQDLLNNYQNLLDSEQWIACQDKISYIDPLTLVFWIDKLGVERIESKYNSINNALKANNNDWETTFYQKLARNFGFKTNGEPFELLAKSLPIEYLAKCKDNLTQLEALLFGQGGFFESQLTEEPHYIELKKEYEYLRHRFQLTPIKSHLWKFSKLRPINFPTIRIAQFAKLIHRSNRLFSRILEISELKELFKLFDIELDGYWQNHYTFQKDSPQRQKRLGNQAVITIIINTVIPFLFIFGEKKNKTEFKDKAVQFLHDLPAENNRITKKWESLGIKQDNAYQTQALIHLKNNYCEQKKCLDCRIGNQLINQKRNE